MEEFREGLGYLRSRRHLMILVLAVAMVSASVAPLVRPGTGQAEWVSAVLALAMSPAARWFDASAARRFDG